MASLDTLALYERILAHVRPQELHRSSNIILKEQYSTLIKAVDDTVAAFAKVKEVRDAVNQLEQGKPSAGRSESLLEVMGSTIELQRKLEKNLEKVAAKMKIKDLEVEEKKRKRKEEDKTAESSSSGSSSESSSDSSSSNSGEEEKVTPKKKKKMVEKKENGSSEEKKKSDLTLAQETLGAIRNVKVTCQTIEDRTKDQWVRALFNVKLILNRQAGCDVYTTDNAAVEVVARALEASVGVFRKIEWTAEYVKQMKSVLAALSDACSKNEVLRVFFHRARAELESLEMSVPAKLQSTTVITKPAATGVSLEDLLRTYLKLSYKMHSQPPITKSKRIVEALGNMGDLVSVLAQLEQWQDGIFSLDQFDKEMKKFNDVMAYQSSDWKPLSDPSTIGCLDKLTTCIELIKKKEHRAKRMKTVNKWKGKCLSRQ
eukprot:jgi/Phyca11/105104/e_gw1.10.453.1